MRVESRIVLPHERFGRGFGGISALAHDRRRDRWLLISDDRSVREPARFYRVELGRKGEDILFAHGARRVFLRDRQGATFPQPGTAQEAVDPEAIRMSPDGSGFVWASEGDARGGYGPAIRRMDRQGRETKRITLPDNIRFDPAGRRGTRDNRTIEGMDFSSDGALWIAMEAPLIEDGPVAGIGRPALVRFIRLKRGERPGQFAYPIDAIPVPPQGALADNGVSEILALDDERFLVLERSGAQHGDGRFVFHCRLYLADFRAATDLADRRSLTGTDVRAAQKTLLIDFDQLPGEPLGNLEGMAWWPDGIEGRRHILFVNDNGLEAETPTELLLLSFPVDVFGPAAD